MPVPPDARESAGSALHEAIRLLGKEAKAATEEARQSELCQLELETRDVLRRYVAGTISAARGTRVEH